MAHKLTIEQLGRIYDKDAENYLNTKCAECVYADTDCPGGMWCTVE
jgi:hypothetical protein